MNQRRRATTVLGDHARARPAEPSADTRVALLTAGRKHFSRKGFDGASVRAITREAGANLGAITYHFGSKRSLYAAVLEDGLRPLVARLEQVSSAGGSGLDRMLGVVDAYMEHLGEHPDLPHLLLQEVAAGKPPPPLVVEIVQRVKSIVAGLYSEGVADGSVRPGHPVLGALSVVAQPIYLTLVAPMLRVIGGLDLADRSTRQMVRTHIKDFVRAGLSPGAEVTP